MMQKIKNTGHYILTITTAVLLISGISYAVDNLLPQGNAGDNTHYSLKDIKEKLLNINHNVVTATGTIEMPPEHTATFPTLTEIWELLDDEKANIKPENIKAGISIMGVDGNFQAGATLRTEWSNNLGAMPWDGGYLDEDTWEWISAPGGATKACADLVYNDHDDWELPTAPELLNAFITSEAGFQADYYWSVSEYPSGPAFAFYVHMDDGGVFYVSKDSSNQVRCVR